jgi:hypothetical protein
MRNLAKGCGVHLGNDTCTLGRGRKPAAALVLAGQFDVVLVACVRLVCGTAISAGAAPLTELMPPKARHFPPASREKGQGERIGFDGGVDEVASSVLT